MGLNQVSTCEQNRNIKDDYEIELYPNFHKDQRSVNYREMFNKFTKPIEVFFCYSRSRQDNKLMIELEKSLSSLSKEGLIKCWHDGKIGAGQNQKREIDIHLDSAQIILLLISPDFMDKYSKDDSQVKQAMAKYEAGENYVFPILLKMVDWGGTCFSHLQPLPKESKFVDDRFWKNQNQALARVAQEIRTEVEKMLGH